MQCPACFHALTEVQVGSLLVDVCQGGCGGIWFDAFELQQVDGPAEAAGESLLHIQRDERVAVDALRKRDCPRCPGIKLYRHFFSAQRRVEVDQCPNCGGYWLDAGELELIRQEHGLPAKTPRAGQAGISAEAIRYLYRLSGEQGRPP
jgi:Zn-finger nucleic acid-binding protein